MISSIRTGCISSLLWYFLGEVINKSEPDFLKWKTRIKESDLVVPYTKSKWSILISLARDSKQNFWMFTFWESLSSETVELELLKDRILHFHCKSFWGYLPSIVNQVRRTNFKLPFVFQIIKSFSTKTPYFFNLWWYDFHGKQ